MNNVIGIGNDISLISRFTKKELIERFLSKEELEVYYSLTPLRAQYFAASRWSVKESYVKATGNKLHSFKNISVMNDANGKPYIKMKHPDKNCRFVITISHDNNMVSTFVMALK